MRNITKRLFVSLTITLLTATMSFSSTISDRISQDSIVSVTASQLKEANLIFAEHEKLLKENALLYNQINYFGTSVSLLQETDSLRLVQINSYKDYNNSLLETIDKKDKTLLYWKVGGIAVSFNLLLFLLLK